MHVTLQLSFGIVVLLGIPSLVPSAYGEELSSKSAKPQEEEDQDKSALAEKACGSRNVKHYARTEKDRPIPEAPPDKALIYVIRPTKYGRAIQTKLAVD